MASEQPSPLLFNIRDEVDGAPYTIQVDVNGRVIMANAPVKKQTSKKKKKVKPDPLWDLEPHKVQFPDNKNLFNLEYTELFLSGPDPNMMTFTTTLNNDPMITLTFPPYKKNKNPEKFIHKCCVCNQVNLDNENVVCDPCLIRKDNSMVLEGEDIRQHDLILGE